MKILLILTILLIILGKAFCTYHGIPFAERLDDSNYTVVESGNNQHMPTLPVIASVALVSVGMLMGSNVKKG